MATAELLEDHQTTTDEWTAFRLPEQLVRKAGVTADQLPQLACKELVDNALDASPSGKTVYLDWLIEGDIDGDFDFVGFVVEDQGPGIAPEEVPRIFAMNRPLISTKTKLPTRGALGNGTRVVAGLVYCYRGEYPLVVHTRGRRLELVPQVTGETIVVSDTESEVQGFRIEVRLDPLLISLNPNTLDLGLRDIEVAGEAPEPAYKGKTSLHWYSAAEFFEYMQASPGETVLGVVSKTEGLSAKNASKAVPEQFRGVQAAELSPKDCRVVLQGCKEVANPVKPTRLKRLPSELLGEKYVKESGEIERSEGVVIPYLIEVWASPATEDEGDSIEFLVNRSPIVGKVSCWHSTNEKTALVIDGCGFDCIRFKGVGRGEKRLVVNLVCPDVPILSDGKTPDFTPFRKPLQNAIATAAKRATLKKNGPPVVSCKQATIDCIEDCLREATSNFEYSTMLRQLYYVVRPIVFTVTGKKKLTYDNFNTIVTEYENENGRLRNLYRDDRGKLYHPHLGKTLPLGDVMVESYQRPPWTFNKVLFIEKEGFFSFLIQEKWPEKHDCALITTKGQPTRAVRDLLDYLHETSEPLTVFCAHDCDAAGTIIYQSLQNETKARGARNFLIHDIGLHYEEAVKMGLGVEEFERSKDRRAVADDCPTWLAEWFQTHRYELNAMKPEVFLQWLTRKINEHSQGKVNPPEEEQHEHFYGKLVEEIERQMTIVVKKEGDFDRRVDKLSVDLMKEFEASEMSLHTKPEECLASHPESSWRDPVQALAEEIVSRAFAG